MEPAGRRSATRSVGSDRAGRRRSTREYYFNDHGAQIDRFTRSLIAAAKGEPAPEDGYAGDYIGDIAAEVRNSAPGILDLPEDEPQETFRSIGVDLMFKHIKRTLHEFGVDFDVYFHENSLFESGAVERAVEPAQEFGQPVPRGRGLVAQEHRLR